MKRVIEILLYSITCSLLLFACSTATNSESQSDATRQHPNVILILTDDQGYGDIHLHGNDTIDTPVLDNFARDGIRLDRFFVSPVCAPTRASLLTGRYNLRTGAYWVTRNTETIRSEEVTLAEVFKEASYHTGCFGKWHNGSHYPSHPLGQGFDTFMGFCAGHLNNYFDAPLEYNGDTVATQGYITDVLTDSALAFIEKNKEQPFFCYVPYNTPHTPFQVPDKYYDKYYNKLTGVREDIRKNRAAIYGMCENIDDNVGRILKAVEKLGLRENTIVLFMTDNGPKGNRYNGGMRGSKGSVHEGGVRVPCFIQWPGTLPEGKIINEITGHIDILPTLASLCNIALPENIQPIDGVNLSALLKGETDSLPERSFFTIQPRNETMYPSSGAVRTSRYRLVVENEQTPMLFDMVNDPGEQHNLAAERSDLVSSLLTRYKDWYHEVTQPFPAPLPIPVGYDQAPVVSLPAHEAEISGDIAYKANVNGWANDWLVNWKSTDDRISWHVDVAEGGTYVARLKYTCPQQDMGATIAVTAGEESITATIDKAYDPPIIPSPDRIMREVEAFEKTWATLTVGEINLKQGEQNIVVSARQIPGEQVGELKALVLEKLTKQ